VVAAIPLGADDASRACASKKLTAASKKSKGRLTCFSKAEKKDEAVQAAEPKKAAAKKPAAEKAPKAAKADAKAAPKKDAVKKDAPAARPGVLKVHHLRPVPGSNTPKTRVGRGEGSKGKTAGRGTKGTKARYQVKAGFEGGQMPLHMRTPKLRGFKNPFRVEYQVVNLDKLAELYPSGGDVTVSDLVAKGAVRKNEKVKVLGTGDIAVKLTVSVDKVSGSAEQKIVAAGGSVK
jgi:large subunit ribosomal protein L15